MQLSALSLTYLLIAAISAVAGIVSAKTELFAISAGCIAVPGIYLYHYLGEVKKQIELLEFIRKTDAIILRQNSEVHVTAEFTPAEILSKNIRFEDLIPAGAVLTSGTVEFQDGKATYTILLPVAGKSAFRGVRVTASCIFGTCTFTLNNAVEPKLTAYMTGTAALTNQTKTEFAEESCDRYAIVPSAEVRDFRQYHAGDSMRDIDWKQTIRRDTLFIRQKMDTKLISPLLILDLPDSTATEDTVKKFLNAANAASKYCNGFDETSVVFTCKGNIIDTLPLKDTPRFSRTLLTAGKKDPIQQLYHEQHKQELIFRKEQLGTEIPETDKYRKTLSSIYTSTAKRADGTFERQSRKLFLQKDKSDFALIVSAAENDQSHLLYLIHDAALSKTEISVYLVATSDRPDCDEIMETLKHAGASFIEVVS